MHVDSIKCESTYAYKYDYIQSTKILMFSNLQCWRYKSHWLNMHLIKVNLSTWKNKHHTKTGNKKTYRTKTRNQNKQSRVRRRIKSHNQWKKAESKQIITYLTKRERKTIQRGDFGSTLTLNHPSLINQE